ncbi:putative receptor-like protein kinase At1g80870 [Gastrolobium bilobum]|uniref:putative receptor-like protein kinase At1g80870 n=1 Tax=Gastrolobium bilobum TaxID=150636 RepID=UPI002AB0FC50|nr:putative receptor-like protein kinase At1g80870 [Gastrolobium bilobum]
MPSRPFPHTSPNFFTKTRVLFLALTISASVVIFCSVLYFLYHLWHSLVHRAKTIPFDASAPLKLQRFSYKDLKQATNGFDTANVIGKGGSGTVFSGVLKDGKLIAIKRLDTLSLQSEREFQNELQILGGLRSPFLVTLLGYCVEKNKRVLVYEYMPNRSLQESLFGNGCLSMSWESRFCIILDVARALEFLHLGCDPPVIHGDIKPSNVLLDAEYRGKISDFGLSRIKVEGEFGLDLFSQDLGKSQELWKSQELSGNLTAETPAIGTPVESVNEVDFALALQASSSSKNSRACLNVRALNLNSLNYNANIAGESGIRTTNAKGKEISTLDIGGDDWNNKFVPYDDEFSSIDYSKELTVNASLVDDDKADGKQWGKDWWWRQDGSGELCSKDYVTEWIGSQIGPSNSDWDDGKNNAHEKAELENSSPIDKANNANGPQLQVFGIGNTDNGVENEESRGKKNHKKKHRKMQEWWKEEHLAELSKKTSKLKNLQTKWKKGLKVPHFDLGRRFYLCRRKNFGEEDQNECDQNGEFSFRRGWKKKSTRSIGSDMWSGDLLSRELSSTTSMRGTLCYVAPEYGGCGFLMEKADIYSFGVLILVIVSGRRPLHVLASPMKLEKANLISWCRHLAQVGNILELVDERLKDDYNKEQASLCINLALTCIQKIPELRPDIGDIVKILKGEMDLPPLPFEFSPSPPSKLHSRSRRKQKGTPE